nr:hypothetical protein BaRGS_002669 [Batillaria attramentaria]
MSFLNNDNTVFNNADLYNVKSLPRYRSHFTPTMNNITFRLPPVPLLSQPDDVEESWFCNRSTINHTLCQEDLCLCIHRLHVNTGQMVELVVADIFESDEVGAGHPMHLHGYSFHVLAMERYDGPFSLEHIEEMDRQVFAGEVDAFDARDGKYVELKTHGWRPKDDEFLRDTYILIKCKAYLFTVSRDLNVSQVDRPDHKTKGILTRKFIDWMQSKG